MIESRSLACFSGLFIACAAFAAFAAPSAAAPRTGADAHPDDASAQVSEALRELSGPLRVMTVGLLLDGPPQRGDAADRFKAEVTEMLGKVYDVRFDQRQGDWTLAGIRRAMDGLLSTPKVDAVVTAGFVGSIDACRRTSLKKPVIAARVVDSELLGLPRSGDGSGVGEWRW